MQDITAELEKLIMGYPGQMASLARAAGIERSTLYKFAKGERVPSGEQLYRLTQALGMPPQRAAELMLQGDTLRGSSEPVLRSEVELLLNTLFDTLRRLEKLRALPTTLLPTEPLPQALPCWVQPTVSTASAFTTSPARRFPPPAI